MRSGIVIVALVLLAVGAWWMYSDRAERLIESSAGPESAGPPRRSLPDSSLGVLIGMEQVELYTLHPAAAAAQGRSAEECFHGRLVFERVTVKRGQEGFQAVRDAVFQGLGGDDGRCDEPLSHTHAMRASCAGQTLDASFDFQRGFYVVHGWRGGEDVIGMLPQALKSRFDAVWRRHGLEEQARD